MKKNYEKIENRIAVFHADMPHLPQGGRKWLADNVWWIVLIAAVAGGFGALALVLVTLLGGVFLAGAVFLFSAKFGGLSLLLAVVVVALSLVNLAVAIMAISPLKDKLKKGWLLLGLSLLIGCIAAILTDLIKQDTLAVVKEVVFLAIGVYVLFELRDYFTRSATNDIATRKTVTAKFDSAQN